MKEMLDTFDIRMPQVVMKELLNTFDIRMPQVVMKESLQVTLQLRDFVEILTGLPHVN